MRYTTIALLIALTSCLHSTRPPGTRESARPPAVEVGTMLQAMGAAYQHKVRAGSSERVQIDIHPERDLGFVDRSRPAIESWHVIVTPDRKVTVNPGPAQDPTYFVFTTRTGLQLMYEGRYNVMTSQIRTRGSDPAYIEYTRAPGIELTNEVRIRIRQFIHFFEPSVPHRYVLSSEHARVVHGSAAVGLYYYPGLRSAWYEVRKGVRLNEPGDTNAWDQAFIFVSGSGMAKIGEKVVPVTKGEAYYIPPNTDHVVWTDSDEPLQLIWLAWGEGA